MSEHTQRIGIFAGTFDPVHAGHLAFAHLAAETCRLDKVYLLVEPRPRHKQAVKSVKHREHMVQLAIKSHDIFGSIHLPDSVFTIHETLPRLLSRLSGAQLFMLVGDDVVKHLSGWPQIDELINTVHFVIGIRSLQRAGLEQSLSLLLQTRGSRFHYTIVEIPDTALYSSSSIRTELKDGRSPTGVDGEVLHYIRQQGLYAR